MVEREIFRHEDKEIDWWSRIRGGCRQVHQGSGEVGGIRKDWNMAVVEKEWRDHAAETQG